MVVGGRDLGLLKRLAQVAHVQVDHAVVGPLGKDVGSVNEEGVMRAEVGVELLVSVVGRSGEEEVAAQPWVVWVGRGVVDRQGIVVPLLVGPE